MNDDSSYFNLSLAMLDASVNTFEISAERYKLLFNLATLPSS